MNETLCKIFTEFNNINSFAAYYTFEIFRYIAVFSRVAFSRSAYEDILVTFFDGSNKR